MSSLSASAILIDDMNNTDNFSAPFGSLTATANGNGTVTLARTLAGVDAGINWQPNGVDLFDIATENLLSITPVEPVNGGFYNASLLFFDDTDSFISEVQWIADTNSTSVQNLDVASWAETPGTATQYSVRFRVLPFGSSDAAFTFTEMAAVPEPTALSLLVGATLLLATRRRARLA